MAEATSWADEFPVQTALLENLLPPLHAKKGARNDSVKPPDIPADSNTDAGDDEPGAANSSDDKEGTCPGSPHSATPEPQPVKPEVDAFTQRFYQLMRASNHNNMRDLMRLTSQVAYNTYSPLTLARFRCILEVPQSALETLFRYEHREWIEKMLASLHAPKMRRKKAMFEYAMTILNAGSNLRVSEYTAQHFDPPAHMSEDQIMAALASAKEESWLGLELKRLLSELGLQDCCEVKSMCFSACVQLNLFMDLSASSSRMSVNGLVPPQVRDRLHMILQHAFPGIGNAYYLYGVSAGCADGKEGLQYIFPIRNAYHLYGVPAGNVDGKEGLTDTEKAGMSSEPSAKHSESKASTSTSVDAIREFAEQHLKGRCLLRGNVGRSVFYDHNNRNVVLGEPFVDCPHCVNARFQEIDRCVPSRLPTVVSQAAARYATDAVVNEALYAYELQSVFPHYASAPSVVMQA